MKKTIIIGMGILLLIIPAIMATNLYINKSHSACDDTGTRTDASNIATPWCSATSTTLTKVADGDNVMIAAGIYFGKLRLRNKGGGITIGPYGTDEVILTRAYEAFYNKSSTWTNVSTPGASWAIWSASITSSQDCLYAIYNSTKKALYPSCLTSTICVNSVCSSSPTMNFTWWNNTLPYDAIWHNNTANKVYIKMLDTDADPNSISILIGEEYTIETQNITGNTTTIANFTIQGFKTGIYLLGKTTNLTIKNNTFQGIIKDMQISAESGNISVINNTANLQRTQEFTWTYEHDVEMDFAYLEHAQENIKFISNNIIGKTNGIVARYLSSYGLPMDEYKNLEIGHNNFKDIRDDAIEPEDYANCYNIHHNNFTDCHVVLTLTPSNSSVCGSNFTYNIAIANLSDSVTTGVMRVFKISSSSAANQTSRWLIEQNTMSGDDAVIQSTTYDHLIRNFTIRNNIIYQTSTSGYLFERTGTPADKNLYDYNLYYKPSGGSSYAFKYWSNDTNSASFRNLTDAKAGGSWDGIWDVHSNFSNPSLTGFAPPCDNIACNMSSNGSYVGAVPCLPPNFTDTQNPVFIEIPENLTVDILTTNWSVSFSASDDGEIYGFYVNNTLFNMTLSGTLTLNNTISVGEYYLNITVNDTAGHKTGLYYLVNITQDTETDFFVNLTLPTTENGTYYQNWIYINATSNSSDFSAIQLILWSETEGAYDVIYCNYTPCENNFTGLPHDTGYWNIYAIGNNTFGIEVQSEQRTITLADYHWEVELINCTNLNITNNYENILTDQIVLLNITLRDDMQADFDDVRFSNTTCNINGSILPHDLDKANANNALYWVKTSLTTGINTISMRWGNSTISNANNASNVWTSYGGVWHLNENTSKDSAAHSSNGTPTGVVTLQPGAIGNAVNFTSTSRVELGADSSIDLSESDSFTIEMWTKSLTSAVDRVTYAQSQGACSWNTAMGTYDSDVVSSNIKFTWRDDRGAGRNTLDSGVAESTNWQYIAVKYDNNTLGEGKNSVIFINGTAKSNNATIYNMRAGPATTTMIGYGCDFGTFTGAIDEFRISKNVISNDSINFTYQNIINPSFIVFEDEYEAPTVSAQPTSIYIYDTLKVLGNGILKIT